MPPVKQPYGSAEQTRPWGRWSGKLAGKLGLAPTALAKYKTGKLRQILTPALEALKATGFLARYAFRPSAGGA